MWTLAIKCGGCATLRANVSEVESSFLPTAYDFIEQYVAMLLRSF